MLELYKNIKSKREQLGISQDELAKLTGYTSRSSIAKIEKGQVDLPQTKIELFAKALKTTPSDLMGWDNSENSYYMNPETQKIAQEIYENKNLSLLFDAARDAPPEDLQTVHTMLSALKKKENHE